MSDRLARHLTAVYAAPPLLMAGLGVGGLVFLAALLGILTRPPGMLAIIWFANALLLMLLLRVPGVASWAGWLGAMAGYLLADVVVGMDLQRSLLLNAVNLADVATGYLCYRWKAPGDLRLGRPESMLRLMAASAAASLVGAALGGMVIPHVLASPLPHVGLLWFSGEMFSYMTILPMLMAAPGAVPAQWHAALVAPVLANGPRALAPVAVLLLACLLAQASGGPGAVAFPVPALLWCALVYPVFPTALLTLLAEGWMLFVLPGSLPGQDPIAIASFRLGASLIAMGPIMVACVMYGRNELLKRLQHDASHDTLTGALERSAFHKKAGQHFVQPSVRLGILMMDLDRFKEVNDTHGHAAGDAVLAAVAQRVQSCLRSQDLFGRLGGEEFAVAIEGAGEAELLAVGERIRHAIVATPVDLAGGGFVSVTVSIGMAHTAISDEGEDALGQVLAAADEALYRAKGLGRNQVVPAWLV